MKHIHSEELHKNVENTLAAQIKICVNYVDIGEDETVYSISVDDTDTIKENNTEFKEFANIEDRREFKIGDKVVIILLFIRLKTVVSHSLSDINKTSDLIEEAIKLDEEGGIEEDE